MSRNTLRMVAVLIGALALGAFGMGIANAPQKGRLPGERAAATTAATVIEAAEATPLSQERIEGAPPPRELTEEEKAKLEADKLAKEEAEAAAKLAQAEALAAQAKAAAALPAPGPDRVGDLLDSVTPPPFDDPPH